MGGVNAALDGANMRLVLALALGLLGPGLALRAAENYLRPVLSLRGGDPAPTVNRAATSGVPKRRPAVRRMPPKEKPQAFSFGLRDAVTSAFCLSALGAAHLYSQPFMAAAVATLRIKADFAWCLFGTVVGATLFAIVRLTNMARTLFINHALSTVVLGKKSSSSLPSLAVMAVMGTLASFKTLPNGAC